MINQLTLHIFFLFALLQLTMTCFLFYEKNFKVNGIKQFVLFSLAILAAFVFKLLGHDLDNAFYLAAYNALLVSANYLLVQSFANLLDIRSNKKVEQIFVFVCVGIISFIFLLPTQLKLQTIAGGIELISGLLPLIYLVVLCASKSRASFLSFELMMLGNTIILCIVGRLIYLSTILMSENLPSAGLWNQSLNTQIQAVSLMWVVLMHVMLLICFLILLFKFKEIELQRTLETDHLTGVYNRRAFFEKVKGIANKNFLYFILIDADFFKNINDNYGHLAGDAALKHIASVVSKNISKHDIFARYGGEEFIIAISTKTEDNIQSIAERIRSTMEQTPLHYEDKTIPITLSLGVSKFTEKDNLVDINLADEMLYKAKECGRNRAEFSFT